jgi:hypothetical protein
MRPPRPAAALPLALGLTLLALLAARGADASVHEYAGGGFAPRANSFFFHGGSEGLYASDPSSNSSASFIMYAPAPPASRPSQRIRPFLTPSWLASTPRVLRIACASWGTWGQDQMRMSNAARFVDLESIDCSG